MLAWVMWILTITMLVVYVRYEVRCFLICEWVMLMQLAMLSSSSQCSHWWSGPVLISQAVCVHMFWRSGFGERSEGVRIYFGCILPKLSLLLLFFPRSPTRPLNLSDVSFLSFIFPYNIKRCGHSTSRLKVMFKLQTYSQCMGFVFIHIKWD